MKHVIQYLLVINNMHKNFVDTKIIAFYTYILLLLDTKTYNVNKSEKG